MVDWIKTIGATVILGVLWEGFKLIFPGIKAFFSERKLAKAIFIKNLNPILKASDELHGKISSLAEDDFQSLYNLGKKEHDLNLLYIMYLFANFWARLMVLKLEADLINISTTKRGKYLLQFVTSFESKKNRILDRSLQRMIGESLIIGEEGNFRVKTLYQFVKEYEAPESFIYTKLIPLRELLENTNLKANRQAILMFGVIIRVLTDYYDPKHRIVRSRNLFTNKLDDKNKKDLQYRIFVDYLKFIKNSSKYYKSDHSESVQNNKPKNSLEKKNLKN